MITPTTAIRNTTKTRLLTLTRKPVINDRPQRWLRCDRQHCGCMPRWRQCPAFDWLTQHRKEVR